ncbi:MAG: Dabb family protein [Acidimicrobiales bacterium]
MALRHVVMFRFADGTTDEQVRALADGLDGMPAVVGTMVDYRHGRDAGINETTYDYVVVGDFATLDDYLTYRDHPDHQALIRDLVRPILGERASIQFELPD